MNKDFKLNIIWKEKDFSKIDDKNLSEIKTETYYFDNKNSSENKIVFISNDVLENFKKTYKYGFSILLIIALMFCLIVKTNYNDFLVEKIAPVLLIGIGVMLLGLIARPFSTYKAIVFDMDKNYRQNRILKINILGLSATALNLDFPQLIGRIVINKSRENSYVTFREKYQDKISETAPIIIIKNDELNQFLEVEDLLKIFVQNAQYPTEISTIIN